MKLRVFKFEGSDLPVTVWSCQIHDSWSWNSESGSASAIFCNMCATRRLGLLTPSSIDAIGSIIKIRFLRIRFLQCNYFNLTSPSHVQVTNYYYEAPPGYRDHWQPQAAPGPPTRYKVGMYHVYTMYIPRGCIYLVYPRYIQWISKNYYHAFMGNSML